MTSIATTSLVLALAARPVGAEPSPDASTAEGQFELGVRLMREGARDHDRDKIARACDAFEASNRLETKAGTLLQLGNCRERNQQLASAWAVYREALVRAIDPRKRKLAADVVHGLERRLSTLTIAVDDASRLDGLTITVDGVVSDASTWNRPRPIDGGEHAIAAHAPGHVDWQTTAQLANEGGKARVEVPVLDEIPPPPPEPVAPPPVVVVAPPAPVAPASWLTRRRAFAIGIAGVSVASVAVGAIVGIQATNKQHDAFALCLEGQPTCAQADSANALLHTAHQRALIANLAFGAAGAAAVAAGFLWFTGAPTDESSHRVSVAPSAAPGEAQLVVMGRF